MIGIFPWWVWLGLAVFVVVMIVLALPVAPAEPIEQKGSDLPGAEIALAYMRAQIEADMHDYGVAYFRVNLEGKLERLDPMKVRIRQPWDKPPE